MCRSAPKVRVKVMADAPARPIEWMSHPYPTIAKVRRVGIEAAQGLPLRTSSIYDETDAPLDRPVKPGRASATFDKRPYGHQRTTV